MAKMNPVVHFEMPAKDKAKIADFYSNVFNWKMKQLGSEMGNYLLAQTTEVDENQMPITPGGINGGFFDYQKEEGYNIPHVVISVENIEEAIKNVEKEGGKVLGGIKGPGTIDEIPGVGRYITIEDPSGNRVGVLQPYPRK